MKRIAYFIGIFSFILILACQNEPQPKGPKLIKMPINPNGDSELALLMRSIHDDCIIIRKDILSGKSPKAEVDAKAILTAEATEPEKAASETYQEFAAAYLEALENMENATPEKVTEQYNIMVAECMGCHQQLCPGPMVRIRKLYLE